MSRTFFRALGEHFLQKHAGRVPWPLFIQELRREHVLPEFIPRIPFIEPEMIVPPPEISEVVEPISPAVPDEFDVPKDEPEQKKREAAPELRPKSKPEDDETPRI